MPINITCSQCQKELKLRDEFAGKKIRCPSCSTVLTVTTASSAPVASAPAPTATPAPATKSSAKSTTAQTCPSCQKSVPAGEVSCPHCKYHFKLRRKMGISSVIKSADMYSQGMNVDGSKRVTTSDIADEHAEEGRKIGKITLMIGLIILGIIALVAINFVYSNLAEMTISNIRAQHQATSAPIATKIETWQPFWIYQEGDELLTLTLPLSNISVLTVGEKANPEKNIIAFPPAWQNNNKSSAQFVETVMPPVINTLNLRNNRSRYVDSGESRVLPAIIHQANLLACPYSPQNLAVAPPSPKSKIYLWRRANELNQKGALHGALLSLSSATEKFISDELKKKTPNAEIKITAQLSFIPFINRDLRGGGGSYAHAIINGATLILDATANKPRKIDDQDKALNDVYFAPILIVTNAEVVKPKSATKKK